MNKTLHSKSLVSNKSKVEDTVESEQRNEQLTELMQEMKNVWQEAAGDLLQPRPEAVSQLLKKVLH